MIEEIKVKDILKDFSIAGLIEFTNKRKLEFRVTKKLLHTVRKSYEMLLIPNIIKGNNNVTDIWLQSLTLTILESFEKDLSYFSKERLTDYVLMLDMIMSILASKNNINLRKLTWGDLNE